MEKEKRQIYSSLRAVVDLSRHKYIKMWHSNWLLSRILKTNSWNLTVVIKYVISPFLFSVFLSQLRFSILVNYSLRLIVFIGAIIFFFYFDFWMNKQAINWLSLWLSHLSSNLETIISSHFTCILDFPF